MQKYIMSFDAGTTSSRCILFDRQGQILSVAQKEFTQFFPHPGYVEHDATEIWDTQIAVAKEAMAKIGAEPSDIQAIGITNQRETTVVWDKRTGKPVYHAIVWQCRRTSEQCDKLRAEGFDKVIHAKTGLVLDAYFSATKLSWILDNVQGARDAAKNGDLLFGTIETWLIWNLTQGKVHITDYSNASRTMMFNISTMAWDDEILSRLDIPRAMLPTPMPSSCIYGYTDIFGAPIPISGAAGDQQCALFGQCCFDKGQAKNTYGTGCFLLMNIGDKPIFTKNGLVTTVAWGIDGKVQYALEGSVFVAGAAIKWLRDELQIIQKPSDCDVLAREVDDTAGCYVVPAFTGLGAPYWDQYARGCIVGLTRGVNKKHIVRATLESIAYQVDDILKLIESDSGISLTSLKVDGGASASNLLMQMQADFSGADVCRPSCLETTALGAAYLAGLAVGYWSNLDELKHNMSVEKTFCPAISREDAKAKTDMWHKAVKCSFGWAK